MNYKTPLLWLAASAVLALSLLATAGGSMIKMPGKSHKGPLPPLTPEEKQLSERLRAHVRVLAGEIGERNLTHYQALEQAALYVGERFTALGFTVTGQEYIAEGKKVVNLEAEVLGSRAPKEIVIVGAHYDSAPGTPGANDNATGVAALGPLPEAPAGAYAALRSFHQRGAALFPKRQHGEHGLRPKIPGAGREHRRDDIP